MGGTSRTNDFFEGEIVNRFDGWSIPLQTVHDDTEYSIGQHRLQSGTQTRETHSFWFSDKNLESRGVEGTTK